MKTFTLVSIITLLITGSTIFAQNALGAEGCFPVENATSRLKTPPLKPDRRDYVYTVLDAHFVDVEKRSAPMTLYLKQGGSRDDFVVSQNGDIEEFHAKVFAATEEALICGAQRADGKIGIIMSPSVQFINRSGQHTLTEILDGLRDGKSHYKKNVGGAKAMFVPKMTHVAITYTDALTIPDVSANAGGVSTPVKLEPYGEMWVIDVKALKKGKVETLTIAGGSYALYPVPSIKKMKSLGIN